MPFAYWREVVTKRNYLNPWKPDHPATRNTPQPKYAIISNQSRKSSFELAPKRTRLGPPQKNGYKH